MAIVTRFMLVSEAMGVFPNIIATPAAGCPIQVHSTDWTCGRAGVVRLLMPLIVSGAIMALMTASSVDWTVASNRASIW